MNLKGIDKGVKPAAKRYFLNNIGLFLTAREKILNNFKSDKVPTPAQAPAPASVPAPTPQPTPEPTPEPRLESAPAPSPALALAPEPTLEPTPEPALYPTKFCYLKCLKFQVPKCMNA